MKSLFNLLMLLCCFNQAWASSALLVPGCLQDSKIQAARSKELAQLLMQDQKERTYFNPKMSVQQIKKMVANDLVRRKRVGEIMAEGCFKTAADYTAASLIYQHGDVPMHYYLAFFWANQAVALGDAEQKKLVAMTIDRYLVSIGKKQIFATQYTAEKMDACVCLEPVERSFPDSMRIAYLGKKLADQYHDLVKINEQHKNCPVAECKMNLSPTPKGTIAGFW